MGFVYDDKYKTYFYSIGNIEFDCDTVEDGYEERAKHLARIYNDKLPAIIAFMLPEIRETYQEEYDLIDEKVVGEMINAPTINLSRNQVSYCEQAFDSCHIFSFSFDGDFDNLKCFAIDG